MIACLDVHYGDTSACAAGVAFHDWTAASAAVEAVALVPDVQPYQPGEFFRRELPCLLAVLEKLPPVELIIIDAYVTLGEKLGLGAYLYRALGERQPVIGVAKTKFQGAVEACEIRRGGSNSPLFITAAGMENSQAAERILSMHGPHRVPTLIKLADQLSRRRAAR